MPSETQIVRDEQLLNSTKLENGKQVVEPIVVQPNVAYAKLIETNMVLPTAIEPKLIEQNSVQVEPSTTAFSQPNELEPNDVKSSEDEKSAMVQPNGMNQNMVETNEIGQNVIQLLKLAEPESVVGSDEAKEIKIISHEVVKKAIQNNADEPNVEQLDTVKPNESQNVEKNSYNDISETSVSEVVDRGSVEGETPSGKRVTSPEDKAKTGAEEQAGPEETSGDDGQKRPATVESPAGAKMTDDEADAEYRLTMIQSVREAVNRICEQAVEKTAAMVKNGQVGRPNAVAAQTSVRSDKRDAADDSEVSEFSLPPPPPVPGVDSVSFFYL